MGLILGTVVLLVADVWLATRSPLVAIVSAVLALIGTAVTSRPTDTCAAWRRFSNIGSPWHPFELLLAFLIWFVAISVAVLPITFCARLVFG